MNENVFFLVEKGEKLTLGIEALRETIKTNQLGKLIATCPQNNIVTMLSTCLKNCNIKQLDNATTLILEFITFVYDSCSAFVRSNEFFNYLNTMQRITQVTATNLIKSVYILNGYKEGTIGKINVNFLNQALPIAKPDAQVNGIELIEVHSKMNRRLAKEYIDTVYNFTHSENDNVKQAALGCMSKIFRFINVNEVNSSYLISALNSIPDIKNPKTIANLLNYVSMGVEVSEYFFNGMYGTYFTFYLIPDLSNAGTDEITTSAMKICLNFFPPNDKIPAEFTKRTSQYMTTDDTFFKSAATCIPDIFLKHPKNQYVASAMMQTFEQCKPKLDDEFFNALKLCGTVHENLSSVIYMCSLIDDKRISEYKINNQCINGACYYHSQWYADKVAIISKKYPKKNDEDILKNGTIEEIIELFEINSITEEQVFNNKVFQRLTELIKGRTTFIDINIKPIIDYAMNVLNGLSFSRERYNRGLDDPYEFMQTQIGISLCQNGRPVFRTKISITRSLADIEVRYNQHKNPDLVSKIINNLIKNESLSRVLVEDTRAINENATVLATICRAFNVPEYQKFSFLVNGINFTIDDSLTTVAAVAYGGLNEIGSNINITLVPEVSCRDSLAIPTIELPEQLSCICNFLKCVHDISPDTPMHKTPFTTKVIDSINSTITAVFRRSSEISFVYTYPFMFTFEEKLFVLKTVLATPIETMEAICARTKIQFGSPALRHKCVVEREKVFENGAAILRHVARSPIDVGIVFRGEVGSGPGPTQEFFQLMSLEMHKKERHMWMTDNNDDIAYRKNGLYPRPDANPDDFFLLGVLTSKALQGNKVIDIEFSPAFVKLINGQSVTVKEVDETIASYIDNPEVLIGLDYTYPGIDDLGKPDEEVTEKNLKEYAEFLKENTIGAPILKLVEKFREGFMRNGEIATISIFESNELSRLLCGDDPSFDKKDLLKNIIAEHGYTRSSQQIKDLVDCIVEFDGENQRKFCKFLTGSERFPHGGITKLQPPFSVGLKTEGLPSVSTCAHYLKLPSYPNKEKLKEALIFAMNEAVTYELS